METNGTVHTLRAVVHGRVQGVGFRYWAHHTAKRLGVNGGFVRNAPDGTVVIEAEANDRNVVEALFHALHVGPDACQVTEVAAERGETKAPRFTVFRIAD